VGNNARDRKGQGSDVPAEESVTFEPRNAAELAHFFETNKDRYHEIWIVITKKEHADPQPVTFNDAVAEAVKQGLIDSRTKSLDEHKYVIRFTKRKKLKG
jgi:uncharacterized protein YdeI (YjbR/CyaY-like superfamily)